MFGLIDGNSFYCSCERAFDPKLWGKPLIVLSNNDGCAIARTTEAKKLGVKMGAPWHLIKDKPEMKTVEWRSSNYELYGDMSRRMYQVLEEIFPAVEPYSIDEMFLDLRGLGNAYELSVCQGWRGAVGPLSASVAPSFDVPDQGPGQVCGSDADNGPNHRNAWPWGGASRLHCP